jgi:DNA polymerase-3 subunit beta
MEFTVSKSDLVRELGLSQGVVEKKTTIPILSNVLLEAADDHVTITATDLELGIRCFCPARVKKEGSGTVPARRLLDYTRLLPEGDLNIKFQENQWATIICGRSKTRIAGMSRESFPELPAMPDAIAEVPIKLLASMINRTAFAISSEESRFTLNGALFLMRAEGFTMVATDGHRLAFVQAPLSKGPADVQQFPAQVPRDTADDANPEGKAAYPQEGAAAGAADSRRLSVAQSPPPRGMGATQQFRVLIPRKAMGELVKLAEDAGPEDKVFFSDDDNHLFFQVGNRLLMTRKLTGNFPDFERVLPRDYSLTATLQKDEIKAAIERVAQFADIRSRAIRVQFSSGEVHIFSSSAETGDSEESVSALYEGPNLEIGFNAQYLLDFLRAIPQDQVSFELKDQKSAGELRPAGEGIADQYRYVVMPMRI